MDYRHLSVDKMRTLLTERLEALEAQHFLAQTALAEFEELGKDYAEFQATEQQKLEQFEKVIEVLRSRIDNLINL